MGATPAMVARDVLERAGNGGLRPRPVLSRARFQFRRAISSPPDALRCAFMASTRDAEIARGSPRWRLLAARKKDKGFLKNYIRARLGTFAHNQRQPPWHRQDSSFAGISARRARSGGLAPVFWRAESRKSSSPNLFAGNPLISLNRARNSLGKICRGVAAALKTKEFFWGAMTRLAQFPCHSRFPHAGLAMPPVGGRARRS